METNETNSGNGNSGNFNSGDFNSGYRNSGNRNSGYRNSGNRNSGDGNTGDFNSGDFNSGDFNSGYLNTDEPKLRIFNKETNLSRGDLEELIPNFFYFDNSEWVESKYMTDSEKSEHPEHYTAGGFLRIKEYKKAWKDCWSKANDTDRRKVYELPNWNNELFLEITGIDVDNELYITS